MQIKSHNFIYPTSANFLVLLAVCFWPIAALAQSLTWDVNGVTSGTGGSGFWNETSSLWFNGTTFQPWNNATFDNAIFAGTAGTVTVSNTPINVNDLTFHVGGYSLNGGTLIFGGAVVTNVGVTTINSAFAFTPGFTKQGNGTLALGGNRLGYTGVTTINAGTLRLDTPNALGLSTSAGDLILNNGSTVRFNTDFAHNYTLTGGTVNLQGGTFTWTGAPTLNASSTLNLNGPNSNSTFAGNFLDTGANVLSLTKSGAGQIILIGNNEYTGATTVTQGGLHLGSSGALSTSSNLVFNGAIGTGGYIALTSASGNFTRSLGLGAGQVEWLGDGGFKSSGASRIVNLGGFGAPLTWASGAFVPNGNRLILGTNSNNSLDFQNGIDVSGGVRAIQGDGGTLTGHAKISGVISGSGGLSQVGNGILELSGLNTYSGGTTLNSGTLLVGSDANLGSTSGGLNFGGGTLLNTSTFTTGRNITINAGGATFQTNANFVSNGPISGIGALNKTGAATLTLTGATSYGGGTTISAGTLQIGNGGTSGNLFGNVANSGQLAFNRSDNALFNGAISGTGSLDQRGTGKIVLSGTNSYTGGTNVSAGTLQIGNGGTSGSILGDVTNSGVLAFNRSNLITFNGLVSGMGGIEQIGPGTLVLTGSNTYSGGTLLSGGTLSISTDANLGASNGSLLFSGGTLQNTAAFTMSRNVNVSPAGGSFQTDGDLLMSGPIQGAGNITKQGLGKLTLTAENTYTGGTTINAGMLQVGDGNNYGSIIGNVMNNGLLGFNRSDNFVFDGAISGVGMLQKLGNGTLMLTGNSSVFAGSTSVFAGALMVNGVLGGGVNVLAGGRLEGTGSVGAINVSSGGTVAPGSPFGHLTATGNIAFGIGSTLEVGTNPSAAISFLHSLGTANIAGGTVRVFTEGGPFVTGRRYTILTADLGRSGSFADLTETFPLIDMALAYDATHVYLNVARNSNTVCSLAVTKNQCATSTTGESLGAGNVVFDSVVTLATQAQVQRALDLLSGESYASTKSVLMENSRYLREAVTDRLRQTHRGDNDEQIESPSQSGVWMHALDSSGHQNGNENASRISSNNTGLLIGADLLINENYRLGAAAGYSNSSFNVNERSSSASSDDYHLALYAGRNWGPIGLRLGTAYTLHDIRSTRSIDFPGFSEKVKGDYNASTTQFFAEMGYSLHVERTRLEPFISLAQVQLVTDHFKEKGGASALNVSNGKDNVTYTTLGVHGSHTLKFLAKDHATLNATLGWRQASGDTEALSTNAIGNSSTFVVNGLPITKDALVIGAGINVDMANNILLNVAYNGQISHDTNDHGVRLRLNFEF